MTLVGDERTLEQCAAVFWNVRQGTTRGEATYRRQSAQIRQAAGYGDQTLMALALV